MSGELARIADALERLVALEEERRKPPKRPAKRPEPSPEVDQKVTRLLRRKGLL